MKMRSGLASWPHDASVEVNDLDEVVLVGGSTRIPAVVELAKSFLPVGKTLNQSVNPDEVMLHLLCSAITWLPPADPPRYVSRC
ncbi:unnamed protein product [Prorocentrum cordatum]|uniref:Heat shock protein 70 n=1 Tax=Prorocentrum cordatum TaxID=2364126 RepID=A0ABN9WZN9_9DINO|nr:unnamed protein product [Polarella glacialis]